MTDLDVICLHSGLQTQLMLCRVGHGANLWGSYDTYFGIIACSIPALQPLVKGMAFSKDGVGKGGRLGREGRKKWRSLEFVDHHLRMLRLRLSSAESDSNGGKGIGPSLPSKCPNEKSSIHPREMPNSLWRWVRWCKSTQEGR